MHLKSLALTWILLMLPLMASALPVPKEGLLIPKGKVEKIRDEVAGLGDPKYLKRVHSFIFDSYKSCAELCYIHQI